MFYTQYAGDYILAKSIPELLVQIPGNYKPKWNLTYLKSMLKDGFWLDESLLCQTHFQDIFRIPIGYELDVNSNEELPLVRKWQLDYPICTSKLTFNKAVKHLEKQLKLSVKNATKKGPIGMELSGGLDSSTVAAFTRHIHQDEELYAFTHTVPADIAEWMNKATFLTNEYNWSSKVSEHLALKQYLLRDGFNLDKLIGQYSELFGGCIEVLFPLLNYETYERAHSFGIQTILSGFGGDELVSQHANLALAEFYDKKLYSRYIYERGMKKFRSLVLTPMTNRSVTKAHQPNSHWKYLYLNEFEVFKELPVCRTVQAKELDLIQGKLSIHWQRRIEASKIVANFFGINYHFPLTNVDLMSFFHQLPATYKHRHGYGRYLLRKTLKNYLPDSVIWRCDKDGATAPGAFARMVTQLPKCLLARVSPNYQGVLNQIVNLPKLRKLFESGPTLDSTVIRMSIIVLMIMHYEEYLAKQLN